MKVKPFYSLDYLCLLLICQFGVHFVSKGAVVNNQTRLSILPEQHTLNF